MHYFQGSREHRPPLGASLLNNGAMPHTGHPCFLLFWSKTLFNSNKKTKKILISIKSKYQSTRALILWEKGPTPQFFVYVIKLLVALEYSSLVDKINPLPQVMLLILFFRRLVIFNGLKYVWWEASTAVLTEADDTTCRYRFKISAHNLPHSIDRI